MNSDPEKLRALLDEVLPSSSAHCGPSGSEVLSMLRNERLRRRRLLNGAALLALSAVAAGSLIWNDEPTAMVPVAQVPAKPASIVIHSVNDEQLFALLQGTPAALLKLPNGDRKLLVIEQSLAP